MDENCLHCQIHALIQREVAADHFSMMEAVRSTAEVLLNLLASIPDDAVREHTVTVATDMILDNVEADAVQLQEIRDEHAGAGHG